MALESDLDSRRLGIVFRGDSLEKRKVLEQPQFAICPISYLSIWKSETDCGQVLAV